MNLEPAKIHALQMLNGGYMIDLPNGYHLVDGVEKYFNGGTATFDALPSLQQIARRTVTTHYFNQAGDKLSIEDYETRKRVLTSKGLYDEDGDVEFADLDDEYAYKKFLREWSAQTVTNTIVERTYEFEIIPEIKSASVHISPMRHFGKDLTKGMFILQRDSAAQSAFYEFVKKYGFDLVHKDAKPKSNECQMGFNGLRYAKIGDVYAFSDKDEMRFKSNYVGNYSDCEATLNSDRDYIETKFLLEVNSGKKFKDPSTIREVLSSVRTIHNLINKIDSKNVTRNDKTAAINTINKLENELTEMIKN